MNEKVCPYRFIAASNRVYDINVLLIAEEKYLDRQEFDNTVEKTLIGHAKAIRCIKEKCGKYKACMGENK